MSNPRNAPSYREVGPDYFADRQLRRYAGVWSLWALGVGAVISGDFSGWNLGVGEAGFGGFLVATVIITTLYFCLVFSIAEMSTALPHSGAAYSYCRTAMGPLGGFVAGLADTTKYIITTAVVCYFTAGYLQSILGTSDDLQPMLWLLLYIVFAGLNMIGVEVSFKFVVFITFVALAILAIFFISAVPIFSWDNLWNIEPSAGNTVFLPHGWMGVGNALPFAIWLYLAIEQLPLASEESKNVTNDMPRGIIRGLLTLFVTAMAVTFLNMGIGGGAAFFGSQTEEPLLEGLKLTLGVTSANVLGLVAVAGLIASFHAIIFAYGRNIYALSRAGYFPRIMSCTLEEGKTPHIAIMQGSVVGYAILFLMYFFDPTGSGVFGSIVLNTAVFAALITYILQFIAFLILRTRFAHIDRPYLSPLGKMGAAIGLVIASVTLALLIKNPEFQPGIIGVGIWFTIGLIYYWLVGRKQLALSPEEEFAQSANTTPNPAAVG